jgi:hypothetical protein
MAQQACGSRKYSISDIGYRIIGLKFRHRISTLCALRYALCPLPFTLRRVP